LSKRKESCNKIKFAFISAPHGINGGVKLIFLPGGFFEIKILKSLYFFLNDNFIEYKIKAIKGTKEKPILYFSNIINLDDAKFLSQKEVFVIKSELDKNSISLPITLIGSTVFKNEDGKLTQIGTLENIISSPAYEYLEIKSDNAKIDLLPFTQDFISKIDYNKKTIIISNKSGFLNNEV
jgi:16S rRNA processing protein RimM